LAGLRSTCSMQDHGRSSVAFCSYDCCEPR
jgi:hypothetical protein